MLVWEGDHLPSFIIQTREGRVVECNRMIIYFDIYMTDLSTDDIFKLKNTICIEALQEVNMCNNIGFLNNNIHFIEAFNTNEKLKLLVKTKNIKDIEETKNNLKNKFSEIGISINKIEIY